MCSIQTVSLRPVVITWSESSPLRGGRTWSVLHIARGVEDRRGQQYCHRGDEIGRGMLLFCPRDGVRRQDVRGILMYRWSFALILALPGLARGQQGAIGPIE